MRYKKKKEKKKKRQARRGQVSRVKEKEGVVYGTRSGTDSSATERVARDSEESKREREREKRTQRRGTEKKKLKYRRRPGRSRGSPNGRMRCFPSAFWGKSVLAAP